jgi:uncharacterized protein YndB with AHSA1/START domain
VGSPFGNIEVRGERQKNLMSYTWAAYGLESVVTWTLTPSSTGTHLRMEQPGFRPVQEQAHQGASYRWQRVPCSPGAGLGTDRLNSAGLLQAGADD